MPPFLYELKINQRTQWLRVSYDDDSNDDEQDPSAQMSLMI